MKVHAVFCAHDSPANFAGGPNAWLQRLLPDLRNEGINVTTLVIGRGPEEECPLVSELRAERLPVHFLDPYGQRPLYLQQKVRWLVKQLNWLKPDVFVPNLVIPAYYTARWARQAGIPSIGVVHSNDAFHHQLLNSFVYGSAQWRISAVVAVSKYLETTIAKRNTHEILLERIPYGVPPVAPVLRSSVTGLRIAYVGRFRQEQKRVLDVTQSFCAASRILQGATFSLLGNGPERPAMAEIIDANCAGASVRICDPIPPAEVQEFMQSQDVLVLLSDYEGLPIALQEAMATGMVPVCLSETSGTNELIRDGENGLVVLDRGDGFISALCKLDSNRELLNVMSAHARDTIHSNYSSNAQHKKWSKLITRIANHSTKKKIRLPLVLKLPAAHPSFRGEDRPAPAMWDRSKKNLKRWRDKIRSAIAPRARLRAFRQKFRGQI